MRTAHTDVRSDSHAAASHPPVRKVYIKTYGCQMNVYDSEKMALVLSQGEAGGYQLTDIPETADVILFNTCSIREKAAEKLFSDLGRVRLQKIRNPQLIIGVGGCVASQEGAQILERAPYVDVVFGPQTLHRLPALIQQVKASQQPQVDISFPEIEKFDRLPEPRAEGPTAFVSIMEGCSKYCAYCVVPYTRGTEISRPFPDVLREVQALLRQQVKEITFLGQNVNAYQGPIGNGETADLALLIRTVSRMKGIARIRYTTSHPLEFSEHLIQAYAEVPQLPDHLHLPVQSGSDKILGLMKRGYTALEFKSKLRRLRAIRPQLCVSSDFIVGYPGETEEDFQKTLDLVEQADLDYSFSFLYSPRPGTPAANLPDETPLEEKKNRLQRLQSLLHRQSRKMSAKMVGQTVPVLVQGRSEKDPLVWAGYTGNNRIVHFTAPDAVLGQMVHVEILKAYPNWLSGNYAGLVSDSADV